MWITTRLSRLLFVGFLTVSMSGCADTILLTGSEGIPDENFRGIEPVYATGASVGNLTEAYVKNTESLIIVNGRLDVLCEANEIEDCGPQ